MKNIVIALNPSKDKEGKILSLVVEKITNVFKKCKITILKDGPYIVSGGVPLSEKIISPKGNTYEYKEGRSLPQAETYALCRCGHTKTPPFCDGSHEECKFDGTETASNSAYMDRLDLRIQGPEVDLLDDGRCAFARFCHREDGDLWTLTESSDSEHVEEVIKGARECPAGRLEVKDKEGRTIEEEFEAAILMIIPIIFPFRQRTPYLTKNGVPPKQY